MYVQYMGVVFMNLWKDRVTHPFKFWSSKSSGQCPRGILAVIEPSNLLQRDGNTQIFKLNIHTYDTAVGVNSLWLWD